MLFVHLCLSMLPIAAAPAAWVQEEILDLQLQRNLEYLDQQVG